MVWAIMDCNTMMSTFQKAIVIDGIQLKGVVPCQMMGMEMM